MTARWNQRTDRPKLLFIIINLSPSELKKSSAFELNVFRNLETECFLSVNFAVFWNQSVIYLRNRKIQAKIEPAETICFKAGRTMDPATGQGGSGNRNPDRSGWSLPQYLLKTGTMLITTPAEQPAAHWSYSRQCVFPAFRSGRRKVRGWHRSPAKRPAGHFRDLPR